MNRRRFVQTLAVGCTTLAIPGCVQPTARSSKSTPAYLRAFATKHPNNPRGAALDWFRQARFGLFLHYGLYSILGRHEWVQYRERIRVPEYARLKEQFTADKFDADFITDLALAAGMKYVNLTTRHHDSFCLWDTKVSDFKSTNSPAKRDLVGELATQCHAKGLGLFFYYSHGRDWRHPHAPNNDRWGGSARPNYDPPEPSYATGAAHELNRYLDFMTAQIKELLTNYGPVAGIWLDGIGVPLNPKKDSGGSKADFHCQQLYDLIHAARPHVLVSYKQGLLGTEDFFAPEHKAIQQAANKPMEICTTLQKGGWGWVQNAKHLDADAVMQQLATAAAVPANLLLNTGPLADGSIHSEDVATLREVGRRLKAKA